MFTFYGFDPSLPLLRLLFDPHGLAFGSHDHSSTLEQSLIQMRPSPRMPFPDCSLRSGQRSTGLHCIVSATDGRCSVQSEYVARIDAVHVEGEAHDIALSDEVRLSIDEDGNVMRSLCFE